MSQAFTHIVDLAKEVEPPADGILTRTLFNNEDVKAVIFGFGQGEELSEHMASMPASLHFLKGEATLTLGDETVEAQHRLGQFPHRCCFRARGHLQASGSVHVHESFEHIKNVLGGGQILCRFLGQLLRIGSVFSVAFVGQPLRQLLRDRPGSFHSFFPAHDLVRHEVAKKLRVATGDFFGAE